ncbi:hypothetical protein D9M69_410260 [compost metagenome]
MVARFALGILQQRFGREAFQGELFLTGDDDHLPGLQVAAGGRPAGAVEQAVDGRRIDRRIGESADRDAFLQEFGDRHGQASSTGWSGHFYGSEARLNIAGYANLQQSSFSRRAAARAL